VVPAAEAQTPVNVVESGKWNEVKFGFVFTKIRHV